MDKHEINEQVARALAEDVGSGDVTAHLLPDNLQAKARILTREAAVCCGQAWVDAVFAQISSDIVLRWQVKEGEQVAADTVLLTMSGPARALMTAERTALNFLQSLSGTATVTRQYVEAVAGTGATILDTRKTLPGLRTAQKYAVQCGGGANHRMGLYDAFLIKENHISLSGGITTAVNSARQQQPGLLLEVEVETFAQLQEAVEAEVDRVLLDNFDIEQLREAVQQVQSAVSLEASGGITLENIHEVASTGVDFISIGALTKHVRAIDLSMRVEF